MPPFFFTNAVNQVNPPLGTERIPCDLAAGGSAWVTPTAIAALAKNVAYVDTGTLNAMVLTIPGVTSMVDLLYRPVWVIPAFTNTTNALTLNVNGLGVQNFNTVGTGGYGNVGIGTLAANKISEIIWDGTTWQYLDRVVTASTAQIIAGTDPISPITSLGLRGAWPFGALNITEDYQTFPNGLIHQFGVFTPSTGISDTHTLPLTFPNRGVSCGACVLDGAASTIAFAQMSFANNSTVAFSVIKYNIAGNTWANAGNLTVHWWADGY